MNRPPIHRPPPRAQVASRVAAAAAAVLLAACNRNKSEAAAIPTAPVERRNIVVSTEATGTVEPVDTVAVKSQASGLIVRMPVEIGTAVKSGDLIAQLDTRTLNNDYQRAAAAQQSATATLTANRAARRRSDALFEQGVITAAEHEAAVVNEATAQSSLVAAQTNLRVARQNLEYATIRASAAGTVIRKNASVGTVAASAISNVGGGSTIVTIADLSRVRMRVLVNETDIANVHPGQEATVTLDAIPNRRFAGFVEKVEPQAVVEQSVTMFPVLVSLDNPEGALLPGMNGQVTMVTQQRMNVLAVPNDAVRAGTDLTTAATALGIDADSMRQVMTRARQRAAAGGGDTGARASSAAGAGAGGDSSARGRWGAGGNGRRRRMGGDFGAAGGNAMSAGGAGGAGAGGAANVGATGGGTGTGTGRSFGAAGAGGGRGARQFVFVKTATGYEPRPVRLGASNYDYAEVLSGVREGERVALLSVALVQQRREQQTQRARNMTGGMVPGGGGTGAGAGGRAGGGGGGGR